MQKDDLRRSISCRSVGGASPVGGAPASQAPALNELVRIRNSGASAFSEDEF